MHHYSELLTLNYRYGTPDVVLAVLGVLVVHLESSVLKVAFLQVRLNPHSLL